MKNVVIVSGARTAIGSFGGIFKDVPAIDLGSLVMGEVLRKVNLKPVPGALHKEISPDKLKDAGQIDIKEFIQIRR